MRSDKLLIVLISLLIAVFACDGNVEVVPWKALVPARKLSAPVSHLGSNGEWLLRSMNDTIYAAWKIFKLNFKRIFMHPIEELKRFEIFSTNFVRIHLHNQKFKEGKSTYTMKLNQFSDRTKEELKHTSCLLPKNLLRSGSKHTPSATDLPKSIDWREYGAVTPVKNQGHCGSCWAFSTTGSIEGQYFKAKGKLMSFSEQQLVDCSTDFGNNGCNGGLMDNAFLYIENSHGLNTEDEYPYVSGDTKEANPFCLFNKSLPHVRVTGYVDVEPYDADMLMNALATKGPVSIAINAAESFMHYHTGVYSDENCSGDPNDLNHGVLLVGYGEEKGVPYWLVKNSWGPSWGDSGYVKILRDKTNLCGVATQPSYPTVEPVTP